MPDTRMPPPSIAGPTTPLRPRELWLRLDLARQQNVVQILGDLIQRRLAPPASKEVADESR